MTDDIKRGDVLRLMRKHGYTKRQIANGIGRSEQHVGRVLNGHRKQQSILNAAYAWMIGQNHVEK